MSVATPGRSGDWPVRVDPGVLDALATRVLARRARVHLLTGPGGIGKTVLAAVLADRLRAEDHRILPVVAVAELREVPLGAMAPLLSSIGEGGDLGDRLQQLYAAAAPAGASQLLFVDDAACLDPVSAAAIHQLVRVYGLRCVMTARTEGVLPAPLVRLADEGYVEITEVAPLDETTANALVEAAIGPIPPAALQRMLERAAGVPLYLRELAHRFPDTDGIPPRIRQSILARLAELDADTLEDLGRLAIAGSWPADLVRRQRPWDDPAVRQIAVRDGDEIRIAHPLLAEVVIERMSAAERNRLSVDAAERLTAGDEESGHRATVLLAGTDTPPSVARLARSASHYYLQGEHDLAIRLAELADRLAAERGEPRPVAALAARASSLSNTGALEAADTAFEEALREAGTDETLVLAATRAGVHYAVRRQRPDLGAALIEGVIPRVASEAARRLLRTEAAKWRWRDGGGAEDEDSEMIDVDAMPPAQALNTLLLRIQTSVFAGRLTATAEAVRRIGTIPLGEDRTLRHVPELVDFGDWLRRLLAGDGAEAVEFVRTRRRGPFDEATGMWAYALALHAYLDGDLDAAFAHAAEAVERLVWRDFVGAIGPARALHATIAAAMGRRTLARESLADIDPLARHNVLTIFQIAEAEAALHCRDGDLDGAAATIAGSMDPSLLPTHGTFAIITAHAAVRFGRPAHVIDPIRVVASRMPQVPVVAAIAEHAEALVAASPEALMAAAHALARVGFRAGAADAARQAAAIARDGESPSLARRATRLASRIAAGLPAAEAPTDDALSAREREIATLAAARHRNREIAEGLGLSVRTVENHLASIYRKLGVDGRDALRDRLGAWPA